MASNARWRVGLILAVAILAVSLWPRSLRSRFHYPGSTIVEFDEAGPHLRLRSVTTDPPEAVRTWYQRRHGLRADGPFGGQPPYTLRQSRIVAQEDDHTWLIDELRITIEATEAGSVIRVTFDRKRAMPSHPP